MIEKANGVRFHSQTVGQFLAYARAKTATRAEVDNLRDQRDAMARQLAEFPTEDQLRSLLAPAIDPEVFRSLTHSTIDLEALRSAWRPAVDPEVLQSLRRPAIDPETLRSLLRSMSFRTRGASVPVNESTDIDDAADNHEPGDGNS